MKTFDLGLRMFVGTLVGGLASVFVYLALRSMALYVHGGNHPLVDALTLATGPAFFVLLMVSLVVMYGDGD